MAALTLKIKHPDLAITVVRSKEIGIIGLDGAYGALNDTPLGVGTASSGPSEPGLCVLFGQRAPQHDGRSTAEDHRAAGGAHHACSGLNISDALCLKATAHADERMLLPPVVEARRTPIRRSNQAQWIVLA